MPPDFYAMEDNDTLFLEAEGTRDTQRIFGQNPTSFMRHLNFLVHDHNTCPLWEMFGSDNMNDQRDNVLQHMRKLWNNWRGSLHKNMKSKPLHEVLNDVPIGVDKSYWEWLVNGHFLSDMFK
ncbi:hypothetical protein H5410_001490, partial [Solanum commersonii]